MVRSADDAARTYNADRARELLARLARLAGREPGPDSLREAIAGANRARAAARRLVALRVDKPRITGSDAMPLLGAFWQLEPERYASLATAAVDSLTRRAPLDAPRVLVAGVPVDGTTLHADIEAAGAVVVAELSPFGTSGARADIEVSGDPFAALADYYARKSIDARLPVNALMQELDDALRIADAVVISLPADDASFGWDYRRIRELLARRSIPHTVLTGDAASGLTAADRARIDSLLRAAAAQREKRCG